MINRAFVAYTIKGGGNMRERLITLDWIYEDEYDFIIKNLKEQNILHAEHELGRRYAIDVASVDEKREKAFRSILEEVLFTSFKWKYYDNAFSQRDSVEDKAIRYCLLDFDAKMERKFFRERIFCQKEIHIDAEYNFSFGKIKEIWLGYVDLLKEFYLSKPDRIDKLELVAYMLSENIKKGFTKAIKCYISQDSSDRIVQDIFYYREKGVKIPDSEEKLRVLVKDLFGNLEN